MCRAYTPGAECYLLEGLVAARVGHVEDFELGWHHSGRVLQQLEVGLRLLLLLLFLLFILLLTLLHLLSHEQCEFSLSSFFSCFVLAADSLASKR